MALACTFLVLAAYISDHTGGDSTVATQDVDSVPVIDASVPAQRRRRVAVHDTLSAPLATADTAPITDNGSAAAKNMQLQGKTWHAPDKMAMGALRKIKPPAASYTGSAQDMHDLRTRSFEQFVAAYGAQTPEEFAKNMRDEQLDARIDSTPDDADIYVEHTRLTPEQTAAYSHLPRK